tara:strand:+ start:1539 stop:1745 length:207 start_codon:yes stop_codon:yes gene_type:complete
MDMKKYYAQLVGCKIVDFKFEQDEYAYAGDAPFPVFTLQLGDQKVKMSLSMDEEGNGGGFAFIEEVSG